MNKIITLDLLPAKGPISSILLHKDLVFAENPTSLTETGLRVFQEKASHFNVLLRFVDAAFTDIGVFNLKMRDIDWRRWRLQRHDFDAFLFPATLEQIFQGVTTVEVSALIGRNPDVKAVWMILDIQSSILLGETVNILRTNLGLVDSTVLSESRGTFSCVAEVLGYIKCWDDDDSSVLSTSRRRRFSSSCLPLPG
jgi:hypothetical protein